MKKLHIEQYEHEEFLGNVMKDQRQISYKTLRFGDKAYDIYNNRIYVQGLVPAFVERQELIDVHGQEYVDKNFPK
jgi:hypothetical protein